MNIKLQKPLDKWHITQLFGKNNIPYYKEHGMLGHNGIDFRCAIGTPVYATHDGTCMGVYEDSSGGIGIDIIDVSEKFKTRYWHIKKGGVQVNYGQKVVAGEQIALSGDTGWFSSPHLHFGLKLVEKKNGVWATKNQDNGFRGGIDPIDYFGLPFYMKFGMVEYGYANDGVKILQAVLMSKGYDIKIDGQFGKKTRATVKEFQKNNNLTVDGVAGEKTWDKLLNKLSI